MFSSLQNRFIIYETSPPPWRVEFEKWRAIRASVGSLAGVLAWVAY